MLTASVAMSEIISGLKLVAIFCVKNSLSVHNHSNHNDNHHTSKKKVEN